MLDFILFIVLSLGNATILCLLGYKFLQILQLSDYKLVGYIEWAKDTRAKYLGRMSFLSLLSFMCALVINACFICYSKYIAYASLILYLILSIYFRTNIINAKKKTPLKSTHRMNRLIAVLFIVCFAASYGLLALSTLLPNILYVSLITLSPLFLVFFIPLAHIVIMPMEQLNEAHFIHDAKKKLKKYPYLIKIGITGSFGKTSTKYILNSILSKKYNVCMSPHSFNTPMGLCKVVDKYLEPYHEILIAEMGANACKDISFLCNIINPKIGIITGVNNQHLRTFFSMNNIINTKYELVKAIEKVDDGFMVFNGCNNITQEYFNKCNCNKVLTNIKNNTAKILNVECTLEGTSFTLVINNKEFKCHTVLCGKHIVQDILLAVEVAVKLKVSEEDIAEAINNLKPIAHRLEISKVDEHYIIDDAYNSNINGYISALNLLNMAKGKKIIVTPGLVELGKEEKSANTTFGYEISKICDICVVVNEANAKEIIEGINKNEQSKTTIINAVNLDDAKIKLSKIIEPNCCILIENDLPDNYI